jgi:alkylhydroperoxidase/carboxymuconolactone decarboxylase family protein YurZ
MPEHPLKTIQDLDPILYNLVQEMQHSALGEGVLSRKHKILITLALDAAHGAVEGVRALAQLAIQAGATKEEIAETLRIALYTNGAGSIYTASRALKEIL